MQRIRAKIFPDDGLERIRRGKALIEFSVKAHDLSSLSVMPQVFDWTRLNVGSFDVIVGDYLNRHNYQAFNGASALTAIEMAMRDGKRVTARLLQLISECCQEDTKLISAASLYNQNTFEERLSRFERQYVERDDFRAFIDQGVDAFLIRRSPPTVSDGNVRAHCVAYQLEELVLFEMLTEAGVGSLVYAGAHLPVMKAIVSKSLRGISHILETLILVELRIFKPQ